MKSKFAIMVNGSDLQYWQIQTVEHLLQTGKTELAAIIVNTNSRAIPLARSLNELIFSLYRRSLRIPLLRKCSISAMFPATPRLLMNPEETSKWRDTFSNSDLEVLRELNLDFALRFGYGILDGEILDVPRHGIWSFHHGDEAKYRGRPPGFWEVYRSERTSGAILQRLTSKLDGGLILKKGVFRTKKNSYRGNLEMLLSAGIEWPSQVLAELGSSRFKQSGEKLGYLYKLPNPVELIRFNLALVWRNWVSLLRKMFLHPAWEIHIFESNIDAVALAEKFPEQASSTIVPEAQRFYADPVLLNNHLLFEDFDYRSGNGKIVVIELEQEKPQLDVVLGETDKHFSYPYVVSQGDETYMIPEQSDQGEVSLYKFRDLELRQVEIVATLIDEPLIDSSVVYHKGLWFLFASPAGDGSETYLNLYYSKRLDGQFVPHPLNPVKIDVRSSRPGGSFFEFGGALHRVAQDCSIEYGGGVAINRIDVLSKWDFAETTVNTVGPHGKCRFGYGLHTITSANGKVAIDVKKYRFSLMTLLFKVRRKVLGRLNLA